MYGYSTRQNKQTINQFTYLLPVGCYKDKYIDCLCLFVFQKEALKKKRASSKIRAFFLFCFFLSFFFFSLSCPIKSHSGDCQHSLTLHRGVLKRVWNIGLATATSALGEPLAFFAEWLIPEHCFGSMMTVKLGLGRQDKIVTGGETWVRFHAERDS